MKGKHKAALAAPTALAALMAAAPTAGAQATGQGERRETVTRMESVRGSAFR